MCPALKVPPLRVLDPRRAPHVRLDHFQTDLVKPANCVVLELSVVALVLLFAPRAAVVRSVIRWAPPAARHVRLAHFLHPAKASASNAMPDRLLTNLEQVHARYALLDNFLLLVPLLAPSVLLAHFQKSLDPSSASFALKELTPTGKVQRRASSAQLALTIPMLVPKNQKTAEFVPKALITPTLVCL